MKDFKEYLELVLQSLKQVTWLRILVTPGCWTRNKETDEFWDSALKAELQNPVFTELETHTIKLNGREIWVSNYPYSYGNNYDMGYEGGLPSRKTAFLLYDLVVEEREREIKEVEEIKPPFVWKVS
jgi:hypothetical protein